MRSGGLRQRGSGGSSIGRLPPFAKHKRVAKVADTVDQWGLWAGLYLRNNAYARLYALLYLFLLHAWLFVVVSFKVRCPRCVPAADANTAGATTFACVTQPPFCECSCLGPQLRASSRRPPGCQGRPSCAVGAAFCACLSKILGPGLYGHNPAAQGKSPCLLAWQLSRPIKHHATGSVSCKLGLRAVVLGGVLVHNRQFHQRTLLVCCPSP